MNKASEKRKCNSPSQNVPYIEQPTTTTRLKGKKEHSHLTLKHGKDGFQRLSRTSCLELLMEKGQFPDPLYQLHALALKHLEQDFIAAVPSHHHNIGSS